MRLRYLIWSNPMILQTEPRIGTAPSIYTESYFLPLFQGPSFWPEPALGGSHVPLLMSPVAWGCPCVRTSVRNLLTPTSHPQPFSHTHPHSSQSHLHILHSYHLQPCSTHPHSSQSHLHILHSYHLTAMLYPPLSLPLHTVHSFTPHSLPPLIASLPHSLPHSQPLPLTASHTHSLSPSQPLPSASSLTATCFFLPLYTVHPGPWWYQRQDPRYKINQDSWRIALVTTCLPQLIQT